MIGKAIQVSNKAGHTEARLAHAIRITAGNVTIGASLNDSGTARAIWDALPIEARASTWGDEIYFTIPVSADAAPVQADSTQAKEVVELGDLGYWPPGAAFCIFFGRTPMSRRDEIRPASPVNVVDRVNDDSTLFKSVASGARVRLERA